MPNPIVRSQVVSIGELLRSGAFAPANVQRDFCWKEPQQRGLLEDLIAAFAEFGFDPEPEIDAAPADAGKDNGWEPAFALAERNPDIEATAPFSFLGAIVLHPGDGGFEVYDGLQRLTTLVVLFAVLRDLLGARTEDEINSLLITEDGKPRLVMPMKHDTLKADILSAGRTTKRYRALPGITEAGERLRECVGVMRGLLHGWSEARLRAFAEFVRDAVLVSVIRISDRRIAGRAFVNINSGGVPLKPEEILKGQLIDLASTAPPGIEDPEARILFVWQVLHDEFGKAGFDQFLRSVDFIERRAPQSADYAIQLMEHIRRRYAGAEGFKWTTDRLLQYRSAFKWVHEGANEEVAAGIHASLRRLQLLKWDQWRAFAMLLKIKSRPHDLDKRIDVLDRACFAMTVATPDPRRCAEMIGRRLERFAKGAFGRQGGFVFKQSQHQRIIRALESPLPDSGRRGTLMRWMEAAQHGDRVPRYISDPKSSVEHVYPKNPGANWTAFEKGLDIELAATLREMTGNLCVLPQDELANAPFDEKRKAYARLRTCKFASEIANVRNWTPDAIRTRTQKLAEQTLKFLDLEVVPD